MEVLSIILLIVLACISLQDFRHRAVSWFLFPLTALLLGILSFSGHSFSEIVSHQLINTVLLALQLLLLFSFFRVKKISIKQILDQYLGLGDILFFLVLALGLPSDVFIVFYLMSLCLSLAVAIVFFKNKSVPLAGLQALLLIPFLGLQTLGFLRVNLNHFIFSV